MENKISENKWKKKAIDRSDEIKRLKRRVDALKGSRDNWLDKYYDLLQQQVQVTIDKPARHHYPVVFIWLCILSMYLLPLQFSPLL